MAPATEEDVVIILRNLLKDEAEAIGLDMGTTEQKNALRDDLIWARKSRLRSEKREDVVRNTLLGMLIVAMCYALFQGARYYFQNGIDSQPAAQSAPK